MQMKTTNSRLQTSRQRPMPMNSLLRVAVFILCLGLLLGVTVPFETEANHPLLPAPQPAAPREVNLQRNTDRDWQFEISASPISGNQKLYLRLGNDWGGIDLGTGQLLLQMQPALDWAFQAQATIGSGGGTVQTTNAAGVVIRLEVPPGALAQDTLITMTPLASSPL